MWGTVLSDPLAIVDSVGRHPADYLMARMPVPVRVAALPSKGCPSKGFIPYYPAFPPAIRMTGVGCIRVTHPSATLAAPKGRLPSDLHVLGLPLAFILSQDQTLRCSIVLLVFSSESRVPPSAVCAPAQRLVLFPYPWWHPLQGMHLCWPQTFKDRSASVSPLSTLVPVRKRVQKYYLFPN